MKYFATRNVKYFASQNVKEKSGRNSRFFRFYLCFLRKQKATLTLHFAPKTPLAFFLRHSEAAAHCSATRRANLAKIPQNFCA
jgi:hypothetical protein